MNIDTKTTLKNFALALNGREYLREVTKEEGELAKELGYVIVFGYSDDNTELRGAIDDEISTYEGGEIYIVKDGILEECECQCKYYQKAKAEAKMIKVLSTNGEYLWEYETKIPHECFTIFDGEDKFCKGIVFDLMQLN